MISIIFQGGFSVQEMLMESMYWRYVTYEVHAKIIYNQCVTEIILHVDAKHVSYSSSRVAPMSRWHAHSRVVVFHTLHRGQSNTRLFPLISYRSLRCTLNFAPPRESSFTSLHHPSPPPPSAVAAAASCTPARSISTCSHHRIPTHAPGARSEPSHSSNSDLVTMYCTTVFCRRLIYSSLVNNPASSLAAVA